MIMSRLKYFTLKKLVLIGCFLAAVWSFAFREDLFQISKNLEIFSAVYKELSLNYVDDINSSKLMKTSIDAMLMNLDPYTNFVQESDMEDYKLQYESAKYGGIGVGVISRNGKIVISELFVGSPANKADLRAGDEIIQINGIATKGKNNDQISVLLKGDKSTPVKMLINRPGENAPLEKNLLRDEIDQPNVPYYGMLPNNVGYIKLDRFLENSAKEVKDALTELQKNNLKGIILDLRNNGGGILQESVKIVNLFVEKDIPVVTQKGRNREKTVKYKTADEPLEPTLPMAVLVNNHSASASEIVAGSLQDLDRAVIIGQRSFGKGLVQQTFSLPYNSLVKVTVAKYYTPSGRCIQALDYTHRLDDGNVEKVADSLITEYKTHNGRSVYDGSGIYPDVLVSALKKSMLTQTLERKFYIFDYATKFRNSNSSIPDAKSFRLTDAQYADFINYLSDKDYNYSTATEILLNSLKSEAEKEDKMKDIKSEYDALKNKLSVSKKNDLAQFKDEIRRSLETEIASRYYFQKGRIENSFKTDEEMSSALKVIENKNTLNSILKGEGAYKMIGKPSAGFSASKK
jgi:carboxyl-terminal processing protease